jgi:hypothetical protein
MSKAMDKALEAIDEYFGPKHKKQIEFASGFNRRVWMLKDRTLRYQPSIAEVRSLLAQALTQHDRLENALTGTLPYGKEFTYKSIMQDLTKAFNKITDITLVELRDRQGHERTQAIDYTAKALTAHLRDPSLLPKPRQKSLTLFYRT